MISVEIVADSINQNDERITTFVLTYPRFIHSELMTHRAFSRNASSSRAIPVEKMIKRIMNEPAMPVSWGKNQKGMQANEEVDQKTQEDARVVWLGAMRSTVDHAKLLLELGIHKQIANRLLEPFAHMTTLVTATDYANFFNLRCHPDAQPEFQELAYQMLEQYIKSEPSFKPDLIGWHLPFADKYIDSGLSIEQLIKISTARAARVSYVNFEGDIDYQKDYDLCDRLLKAEPKHASPAEHAAAAMSGEIHGNFRGWKSYRKFLPNENLTSFNATELLARRRKVV